MSIRVETVTQENFQDLPDFRLHPYSCRYCIYWESTGDLDEKIEKSKAEKIKRDWFEHVTNEFGNCGLLLYLNNKPIGYAQFALPKFFPRIKEHATILSSHDDVFLACLYLCRKEMRGKGLGKHLLNQVIQDLRSRNHATLAVFANKGGESSILGPIGFYLKQGFKIVGEQMKFAFVRRQL
jgi:GNAT superfamily N-acetyltransferase